jgi:hypothetical protein
MNGREEKLARIKTQIAKAVSEISHGDHSAVELALADALGAVLEFLEEEMPEKVLPALHAEPTRPKVKK